MINYRWLYKRSCKRFLGVLPLFITASSLLYLSGCGTRTITSFPSGARVKEDLRNEWMVGNQWSNRYIGTTPLQYTLVAIPQRYYFRVVWPDGTVSNTRNANQTLHFIKSKPAPIKPPEPPKPLPPVISNPMFVVSDLEINRLGPHKIAIFGRVTRCSYMVTQSGTAKTRPWMPTELRITNPVGDDTTATVSPDGKFSAAIRLDDKYFYGSVPRSEIPSRYFFPYHYRSPKSLSLRPKNPPKGVYFSSVSAPLKVSWVDVDWDKVERYVKGKTTYITLNVKDKVTHLPVSPTITVTGDNVASRVAVQNILASEFCDREVARESMKWLSDYLEQSEAKDRHGKSISFRALVGATYKIETVHGQYYYFRNFLRPTEVPEVNKTILLIEKGSKIRVEDVKEGEGGVLVDGD